MFAMQVVVVLLMALTHGAAQWGMAMAALLVAATYLSFPSLVRGAARAGITTDDEGLTEWYPLFYRRRLRWADITEVVASDFRAVLTHPRGHVVLEPPLADWAQIAGRAQRHLGEEPTAQAHEEDVLALPPEEVATWLGIERDGELRCESRFHRRWLWWLVMPFIAVGVALFTSLFLVVLALVYGSGLAAVSGRRRDRRVHEVRATATSLELRSDEGWRTVAWGSIKELRKVGLFQVVHTTDGDLWLPPRLTNAERLLAAIGHAIEARRQGWALPRAAGDVPESALSRAELSVDADRGLSVTGEEPL